jgi:predicted phosphodiesterase
MRVAALYDIHGNLPALEAVLEDVLAAGVDRIVVGGDVLPGPMPCQTLERLLHLELPADFLMGNGDRETLAFRRGVEGSAVPEQFRVGMRWNGAQLTPDLERVVANWPATISLDIPPLGEVLFCHATPRNDTEIFTELTPEERLRPVFASVSATTVVCGHTHMQFIRKVGALSVLNAGSVGMPFQSPGAYWLLLGTDIELRRTLYDFNAAAARVHATSYPGAEDFAARNILEPPAQDKMLEAFTRAQLG